MDIYDRINGLLKEQNKTKIDMATQTGISYNTIKGFFNRRSKGIPLDRDMILFWFNQFKNKSADNKQKSLIIDAFVNKVVLFDDRMIIVYNHLGKNEENITISELCSDNPLLVVLKAQNPNPVILRGHLLLIVPLCSQDTRR